MRLLGLLDYLKHSLEKIEVICFEGVHFSSEANEQIQQAAEFIQNQYLTRVDLQYSDIAKVGFNRLKPLFKVHKPVINRI